VNVLFDAVIIGSGFSGSILGKILAKSGWKVAIIDRAKHPRFAIGESSTPTADFLMAYLADRWQMPELRPLAAWGTWKDKYPEISCGKKRGFTYYSHTSGQSFHDCQQNSQSLMVAASQSDYWSDTHWLRSDVDAFLARQCVAEGCELIENVDIVQAQRGDAVWSVQVVDRTMGDELRRIRARWLIDAGGGGDFSVRWLGNQHDDDWMKTQTGSVFGHFRNVDSFTSQLGTQKTPIDPIAGFHPDDSAQHHVTEEGWMWMLRFDNGVTSVGIVKPTSQWKAIDNHSDASHVWSHWISRYPSISATMGHACHVGPNKSWLRWSNRLSRCRKRAVGDGWVQLPTAYGFVDPLHSTGIAHALSGVVRIAELLIQDSTLDPCTSARWVEYDRQLRQEIKWIDLLVGGCYRSLPSFENFCAFSAWYFASTIQFERVMARDPSRWGDGYLTCENEMLQRKVEESFCQIHKRNGAANVEWIRKEIEPWNDVGLLEPIQGQRIPHTAPPKYVAKLV